MHMCMLSPSGRMARTHIAKEDPTMNLRTALRQFAASNPDSLLHDGATTWLPDTLAGEIGDDDEGDYEIVPGGIASVGPDGYLRTSPLAYATATKGSWRS